MGWIKADTGMEFQAVNFRELMTILCYELDGHHVI